MAYERHTYKTDRAYTDSIHDRLAVKIVYPKMGWTPKTIDKELASVKDSDYSIDYYATDKNDKDIVIQERFRRASKFGFNDLTLRYERENNPEEIEQKSEFFKMKGKIKRFPEPFYMVYGIQNAEGTGFLQYAVIDLRAFFKHYADGTIKVNTSRKYSYYSGGVLYCGHNKNKDNSSSFICVDIALLSEIFSDVVVYQEGFRK